MRGISVHLHFKDDAVVLQYKTLAFIFDHLQNILKLANLDVAFFGVLHLIPAQIVTEAPVILLHTRFNESLALMTKERVWCHLGVEEMCDLPRELCAVPLVDQPQVCSRVAAPSGRLRFAIALWIESCNAGS